MIRGRELYQIRPCVPLHGMEPHSLLDTRRVTSVELCGMSQDLLHGDGEPDLLSDEWLTVREVADILKVDNETLRRWARQGTGPPLLQIATATRRYSKAGLVAWMRDRMPATTEGRAS